MTEQNNRTNHFINLYLKTFIRGLTQNNLPEMYEGYKALFKIGMPAIPQICDAVLKSNWTEVKYPNEIRYVSGMVNLIHDIDETEAIKVINQLKRNGCDVAIARLLDSICKFTLADYLQYEARGIKIFEHKKLITKQNVRAKLEQWLKNVPGEDLQEIERIYVLSREDLESLGSYKPILFCIKLVWDNPCSRLSPMSWVNNFIIESVLYHEIGHHVHRHTFGQDPDQEKEAEKYSDSIVANSNHLIFRIGRIVKRMVKSNEKEKHHAGG